MKSTCEHNRELLKRVKPQMSYSGENYDRWKIDAKKKLSSLIGLDRFTLVDDKIEIEY